MTHNVFYSISLFFAQTLSHSLLETRHYSRHIRYNMVYELVYVRIACDDWQSISSHLKYYSLLCISLNIKTNVGVSDALKISSLSLFSANTYGYTETTMPSVMPSVQSLLCSHSLPLIYRFFYFFIWMPIPNSGCCFI